MSRCPNACVHMQCIAATEPPPPPSVPREPSDDHRLTLAVRDALREILRTRAGEVLTEKVINDRANNGALILRNMFRITTQGGG
jgi:hypothetical protein